MRTPAFRLSAKQLLLILLTFPFAFAACGDDDETIDDMSDDSITNIVGDVARFSTLDDLLDQTDLDGTLRDDDTDFTVFAPNDAAFAAIQSTVDALSTDDARELLLYHVLGGQAITADQIAEGLTVIDNGYDVGPGGVTVPLYVQKDDDGVRVNMATVIDADIMANNGVIHEVDQVILPPSVVDLAVIFDDFSSLVANLQQAGLVDALSADGPFTVFAPTNMAFSMTPTTGLSDARLGEILQLHVVSGNVLSGDLTDGMTVETLNGDSITINVTGSGVTITDPNGNTRRVVATDAQGTNGVVHTIDGVLLN